MTASGSTAPNPATLPSATPHPIPPLPLLAGIVVHWRDEARLAELVAAWPREDTRFELVVVDNSDSAHLPEGAAGYPAEHPGGRSAGDPAGHPAGGHPAGDLGGHSAGDLGGDAAEDPASSREDAGDCLRASRVRVLRPGRNLGFAGGVNAGVAASRAPLLLVLNPDAVPEPGALDRLIEGFAAHPEAAGLAPRLSGANGEPQFTWQLRRLPSAWECLRQTLPSLAAAEATPGTAVEPPPGSPVEQPAAAALALRREALVAAGGFDERFHPAWFEDVDLARRLRGSGARLLYWPAARFRHALGSTVPRLGYGRFLWIYYRNLERYLAKHHGAIWGLAARACLVPGLAIRLPLLVARRPRRAASRREAAAGLLLAIGGALSGWRLPRRLVHDPTADPAPPAARRAEPAVPPAGGRAA